MEPTGQQVDPWPLVFKFYAISLAAFFLWLPTQMDTGFWCTPERQGFNRTLGVYGCDTPTARQRCFEQYHFENWMCGHPPVVRMAFNFALALFGGLSLLANFSLGSEDKRIRRLALVFLASSLPAWLWLLYQFVRYSPYF